MSISVPLETLDNKIKLQIRDNLTLTYPEVKRHPGMKGGFGNTKEPLVFYHIDDGKLKLPMTYGSKLLDIFPAELQKYQIIDIKFTATLRDYQVEVFNQAWEHLQEHGSTTLELHPGWGKTIVGANLHCKTNLLGCVIITQDCLIPQWKKTYQDTTNAKIWVVGEKMPAQFDIIICMAGRTSKVPDEIRAKVGYLLIDEAHTFCTPERIKALLYFSPNYIVAETATLTRQDEMHKMIHLICGTHSIVRKFKKDFNVVKVLTPFVGVRKKTVTGNVNWDELRKSLLFNEKRNNLIVDLVLANPDYKILILTAMKDHVKLLHESLVKKGETCDFMTGNKKSYNDSRVLVGTLSKISTGFDEANNCANFGGIRINLVILCISIKSVALFEQSIGRGFRSDMPNIIQLVDNDNIIKSHWRVANKWYEEHNGMVYIEDLRKDPRYIDLVDLSGIKLGGT